MSLEEKLMNIQQELKAPKGQYNSFGKYNYRSCEDILEAVKPLLLKYKLILTLNDELVYIGERHYVKAIAKIIDVELPKIEGEDYSYVNCITNIGYAREEEDKKGMDGSQITGASSSYARKYALNGLFLIDDVKDSDTTNKGEFASEKQIETINKLVEDTNAMLEYYGISKVEELTKAQASEIISKKMASK